MTIPIHERRIPAAPAVCPFLGIEADPSTYCTFATPGHRCGRAGGRASIAIEHQMRFCLFEAHAACPVFTGERRAPPPDRRPRRPWRAWVAGAVAIALAAVTLVVVRGGRSRSGPAPARAGTDATVVATPPPVPAGTPAIAAIPQAPTPAPEPAVAPPVRYIVRPGDTLIAIAEFFGAREEDIIALNHLPRTGQINAGQELLIPQGP